MALAADDHHQGDLEIDMVDVGRAGGIQAQEPKSFFLQQVQRFLVVLGRQLYPALQFFPNVVQGIEKEISVQYGVEAVGHAEGVRERFYAISSERRLRNPAVLAISNAARHELFGED